MKIPELIKLINEFVNGKDLTEKQKKSLGSKIKRNYNITVQELRASGQNISSENLRSIVRPLMDNYEDVKDYNAINEVMQAIAEDFKTANTRFDRRADGIEKEIERIYTVILGNQGTTIDGMSSEYISKIIRRKLTETDGINRDDIMNVLMMQSRNMYLDIGEYQKLINDSVISYLTNNQNGEKFSNPKIFKIFESLAGSYKVQSDFEKVKEIYEQALRIKSLEDTIEYKDLKKNYEKFLDFLEMRRNFEDRRFDSFEDLMNSLRTTFTSDDIFVKGNQGSNAGPGPVPPIPSR